MSVVFGSVGHRFPGQDFLFRGLSVTVDPARVTAVVGPSGSGKSTLLGMIAGWITPTEGTVTKPDDLTLAWVFQNPHGVARRTVLDHVTLPLLGRGLSRSEADTAGVEILARFGLAELHPREFRALSGGEAQRLMLARAVAVDPTAILVDEPTAQLDPVAASSVVDVLGAMAGQGRIVVIATHDPQVRERCDVVVDLVDYRVGP